MITTTTNNTTKNYYYYYSFYINIYLLFIFSTIQPFSNISLLKFLNGFIITQTIFDKVGCSKRPHTIL